MCSLDTCIGGAAPTRCFVHCSRPILIHGGITAETLGLQAPLQVPSKGPGKLLVCELKLVTRVPKNQPFAQCCGGSTLGGLHPRQGCAS